MTFQLRPLEIASGLVFGEDPGAPPLSAPEPGLTPLAALERALLPALRREPCLVSFSGGRDSSAVIAVAAQVARREGLPMPVPITVRFAGDPESEESRWQELVIGELGITDWRRIEAADELGVLGPVARRAHERHGLLWPPNVHAFVPLLEAAAGGSLVTGAGGDEALGGAPSRRRALLPASARRALARRRSPVDLPWLRPEAQAALDRAMADEQAGEPVRRRRVVEWLSRRRQLSLLRASESALAAEAGTELVEPLLDGHFLASLAGHGSRRDYATREAAMPTLFGGLLPDAVLARRAKARFNRALWGQEARAFARGWDGEAIFAELVDPDELRRTWLLEVPDFRSATALQAAWLANQRGSLAGAGAERDHGS